MLSHALNSLNKQHLDAVDRFLFLGGSEFMKGIDLYSASILTSQMFTNTDKRI